MAKYVQTCLLCKQTYEYCGGCSKYKNLPTFMTTFCSENCKNIYQTMADFENGILSKDKAKLKLSGLNTSRHMFYTNSFAISYNKIMEDEKDAVEKIVEANDNQPVEDADVSATIEKIIENNTISSDDIKEMAESISTSSKSKTVGRNSYKNNRRYKKK